MGEKLFKIKEGSKNSIFCQGIVKFSGQVQGCVYSYMYTAGQFHTVLYLFGLLEF